MYPNDIKTYHRITLKEKNEAKLYLAVDLNLNTIRYIVEDKIQTIEKSFDNLEMAFLSFCFINSRERLSLK